MARRDRKLPWRDLLRPKYWPVLLTLGVGAVVALIPLRGLKPAARPLAWILLRVPRLRHVTERNIAACLPELSAAERANMVRDSIVEMAASLLTAFKAWFRFHPGNREFQNAVTYRGLEHVERAVAEDRPIILLTCHLNSTELNAAFGASLPRGDRRYVAVYRRPSNRMADAVLKWGRAAYLDAILPGTETREIVREIRKGAVTWFAPDLEFHGRGHVWGEFFGVPAATSNAVARFARMTDAVVLPTRLTRGEDGRGFVYEVLPPLEGFPTGEAEADTNAVNAAIEGMIRAAPQEYWWALERFLHRKDGMPAIYDPR